MCATGKLAGAAIGLFLRVVALTAALSVVVGAALWWGLGWPLIALPLTVLGVGVALSAAAPWLLCAAASRWPGWAR